MRGSELLKRVGQVLKGAVVYLVVVSFNSAEDLPRCISSWVDAGVAANAIFVVDNRSSDGSAAVARSLGCEVLPMASNTGFGHAANAGIDAASARAQADDWIIVANPDTHATTSLRPFLVALAAEEGEPVDFIVPRIKLHGEWRLNLQRYPDWSAIAEWILRPTRMAIAIGEPVSLSKNYMVGSLLIMRRRVWSACGGFDARFFLYGEDADLSRRLYASSYRGRSLTVPVEHKGNLPIVELPREQQRLMIESIVLFNRTWSSRVGAAAAAIGLGLGFLLRSIASLGRGRAEDAGAYGALLVVSARCLVARSRDLNRPWC